MLIDKIKPGIFGSIFVIAFSVYLGSWTYCIGDREPLPEFYSCKQEYSEYESAAIKKTLFTLIGGAITVSSAFLLLMILLAVKQKRKKQ